MYRFVYIIVCPVKQNRTGQYIYRLDRIIIIHIHLHTFIRESKKCKVWKYKKKEEKKERNIQNRYGFNSKTIFAPISVKWRLNAGCKYTDCSKCK